MTGPGARLIKALLSFTARRQGLPCAPVAARAPQAAAPMSGTDGSPPALNAMRERIKAASW